MSREFALQARRPPGDWITRSRHATASEAADAAFDGAVRFVERRIVEVGDSEVVRTGVPDRRSNQDLQSAADFRPSKLIAAYGPEPGDKKG